MSGYIEVDVHPSRALRRDASVPARTETTETEVCLIRPGSHLIPSDKLATMSFVRLVLLH